MEMRARAAVYARISQDRDGSGMGVARQLADCRRDAKRRGWSVAEEYVDDDLSAYSGKTRPAYERMLADIRDGQRDAVIVWHMDRLHRRPIELEEFASTCARAGLTDVVTLHGDLNLGTGDGLLVARVLAAAAASESDAKSRRSRRKMQELAEAGLPHGGGTRSFGFEDDRMTHRPDEARVIRELAARALGKESLTSLSRWLTETGVHTVKGGQWRTPTVRELLLSPRIYGMRTHQGQVLGQAAWAPIITAEQGEQLRQLLTDPTRRTNRTARRYLLSGLCRCSRCGAVMVSAPRGKVRRYLCRSGPDFGGCGGMSVTAPPLEDLIRQAVLMRLDSPALVEALEASTGLDSDADQLVDSIRTDTDRLEELSRLWADGEITGPEWRTARTRIDARLVSNRRTLAQHRGHRDLHALLGQGHVLAEQWDTLSISRQAAIVKALVDHIVIKPAAVPGRRGLQDDRVEAAWRL